MSLSEALKSQSERILNVNKKSSADILKLLKKTKRSFLLKYKKGLISKNDMITVCNKCIKFVDDRNAEGIQKLKDMINRLMQVKKRRTIERNVHIGGIDVHTKRDSEKRKLISVVEEEQPFISFKCETISNDINTSMSPVNKSNAMSVKVNHISFNINNSVNMDAAIEAMEIDEDAETNVITPCIFVRMDDLTQEHKKNQNQAIVHNEDYNKSRKHSRAPSVQMKDVISVYNSHLDYVNVNAVITDSSYNSSTKVRAITSKSISEKSETETDISSNEKTTTEDLFQSTSIYKRNRTSSNNSSNKAIKRKAIDVEGNMNVLCNEKHGKMSEYAEVQQKDEISLRECHIEIDKLDNSTHLTKDDAVIVSLVSDDKVSDIGNHADEDTQSSFAPQGDLVCAPLDEVEEEFDDSEADDDSEDSSEYEDIEDKYINEVDSSDVPSARLDSLNDNKQIKQTLPQSKTPTSKASIQIVHPKSSIQKNQIQTKTPSTQISDFRNMTDSTIQSKTKTPSMSSSMSTSRTDLRTPSTSSMYKSKFHAALQSSQKNVVQPQGKNPTNSAMKRTAEDAKRKKELLEEEKLRKIKEHSELVAQRRAQLVKLAQSKPPATVSRNVARTETKPLTNATLSSMKDPLKQPVTSMRDHVKQPAPLNRDPIKQTGPSSRAVQQPSSNPITPGPTKTYGSKSILRPINSSSIAPTSMTRENAAFKTPIQTKSKPVMTVSCHKIVGDHENFGLEGLESANSDDDDADAGQRIPAWVDKQSGTLGRLSLFHQQNTNPSSIFTVPTRLPLHIPEVFSKYTFHVKTRSSSALWKNI